MSLVAMYWCCQGATAGVALVPRVIGAGLSVEAPGAPEAPVSGESSVVGSVAGVEDRSNSASTEGVGEEWLKDINLGKEKEGDGALTTVGGLTAPLLECPKTDTVV